MTIYKKPLLRRHCTQWITNWIANGRCLHVDAYLYLTGRGNWVYVLECRKGGREVVGRYAFQIDDKEDRAINLDNVDTDDWEPVKLNSRKVAGSGAYTLLNTAHWETIVPFVNQLCAHWQRRSVILHYIRIPEGGPTEATMNYWKPNGALPHDPIAELARLLR